MTSDLKLSLDRTQVRSTELQCSGIPVQVRLMETHDYDNVRQLLPDVSTCSHHLHKDTVDMMLSLPTYYPWCAYRMDTNQLVGFAEIYVLPHLGRPWDTRLERVVVASSFRNKGLASKLCAHLIDQVKHQLHGNRIDLTVQDDVARHIYTKKFNFEPVDTSVLRLKLNRA